MSNDQLDDFFDNYNYDCKLKQLLAAYTMGEVVDCILDRMNNEYEVYRGAVTIARDFYISSYLIKKEKNKFYKVLEKKGFFTKLGEYLYQQERLYDAIYNIGKFSHKENAPMLEVAYETKYRHSDPIAAWQCLFEMSWLGSEKVKRYLKELTDTNTLMYRLILFMFYECGPNGRPYRRLLQDREFMDFLNVPETAKRDTAKYRVWNFQQRFPIEGIEVDDIEELETLVGSFFAGLALES